MYKNFCLFILILITFSTETKKTKKLIFERMGPFFINPKYGSMRQSVKRLDRQGLYVNVSFTTFRDLSGHLFGVGKILKFADNTYKETSLVYKRNLCDFLDYDIKLIFDTDHDEGFKNFSKKCPIKKGSYSVQNISTMDVEMPSLLPLWKMRFDFAIIMDNVLLTNQSIYLTVDEVIS